MKKRIFIIMSLLISLIVVACGAKGKSESVQSVKEAVSYEGKVDTPGTIGYTYNTGNVNQETLPEEAGTGDLTSGLSDEKKENQVDGRKLIRNVELSIETLEFDGFLSLLETKVTASGGYIQSSSSSNNSYHYERLKNANYTVRIPSDKLDEFINMIGENSNITNSSSTTDDVTLSYYDSESRKKALEIQQKRLLTLLEQADKIEDIIQLEARLSEVTYELESQSTILRNYDNLVEYSTVTLYINEVERETQIASETISDKMKNGLSDTFYNIKKGLEAFAIFFVINIPYLLFWSFIIFVVIFIMVKKRRKIIRSREDEMKQIQQDFQRKQEQVMNQGSQENNEKSEL